MEGTCALRGDHREPRVVLVRDPADLDGPSRKSLPGPAHKNRSKGDLTRMSLPAKVTMSSCDTSS